MYYSLLEIPDYWALSNPPQGFADASAAIHQLEYCIQLHYIYFSLQGIK